MKLGRHGDGLNNFTVSCNWSSAFRSNIGRSSALKRVVCSADA